MIFILGLLLGFMAGEVGACRRGSCFLCKLLGRDKRKKV